MKPKLYVMDAVPGQVTGGLMYTTHDIRALDPDAAAGGHWRPATRRERLWYAFTRPRYSMRLLVIWIIVWSVIDLALRWFRA